MAAHFAGLFSSALSAMAIFLVAAAAGRRLTGWLLPAGTPYSLQLLFGLPVGLGVISYATLFAGLAGFVSSGTAVAILGILLLCSFSDLMRILRLAAGRAGLSRPFERSLAGTVAAALVAVFLLTALAGALAPPVYYDPLVYHLTVPQLHLLRGAIGYIPENVHAQYPSVLQMLYLHGLQVNDDITVKLLNFGLGIWLALALLLFGRTFVDRRTGLWAAAFLLSSEAVIMTFTRAMVDTGTTLFIFLSFFAIALWDREKTGGARLLVLAGLLGGLGISSKYTTFWIWIVLLGMVFFLSLGKKRGAWEPAVNCALAAGVSGVILLPWLIKTGVYTGNPLFPFFYDFFGGQNWDAHAARRFADYNARMGGGLQWRSFYRLPLEIFLVQGSLENLVMGPLFLFAAPFLFAVRRWPRALKLALVAGVLYLPYWVYTALILRYLVLLVPFFALPYAYAFTSLPSRSPMRPLFASVIIVSMLLSLRFFIIDELVIFEPVGVAIGLETRDEYLGRKHQSYNVKRLAGEHLPPDARILFVGETRGYHMERDYVANSAHDPSLIAALVRKTRSAAGTAGALRDMGITHILYHPGEMRRLEERYRTFDWSDDERLVFDEFMRNEVRVLFRGNGVSIHEFVPGVN